MSLQAWIAVLFIAGVVAQGALFTRGGDAFGRKMDLVLLAGFVIAGFFFSVMQPGQPVYMGLLQSFFIFPVVLAFIHSSEILPRVTEKVLLSCAITFWFMFFTAYYTGTPLDKWLVRLGLLPTAGNLLLAFTGLRLSFSWRVFFYAWFLLLVVLTGLHQFFYSYLTVFKYAAAAAKGGDLALWTFPLAGMAYCQLAVFAAYLVRLVPLKGRNQSLADALRDWREYLDLVSSRYDETSQFNRLGAFGLLAAQGGAMYLNYRRRFMPPEALINISVLLPLAIMALSPEPPKTFTPRPPPHPPRWPDPEPGSSFGEFVRLEDKIASEAENDPGPKQEKAP